MIQIKPAPSQETLKDALGNAALPLLRTRRQICRSYQGGLLLSFPVCNTKKQEVREERIFLYWKGDTLLAFAGKGHARRILQEISPNTPAPQALLEFFSRLTAEDYYALESIEEQATALEDQLLLKRKTEQKELTQVMLLRHRLLKIKRYYEQLGLITEQLCTNQALPFSSEEREQLAGIDRHLDRLLQNTLHLREYTTQIREAYQAQIDIEQNNIMRIFTVITTVFSPLTLIAGWYGMNLKMPEFGWRFGYLFVVLLSILSCLVSIMIFKKKKWF